MLESLSVSGYHRSIFLVTSSRKFYLMFVSRVHLKLTLLGLTAFLGGLKLHIIHIADLGLIQIHLLEVQMSRERVISESILRTT